MTKLQQKRIRLQILAIMDDNNHDWLENEQQVSIIQKLGKQLTTEIEPLTTLGDWVDFKRSDFLYLLSEGYNSNEIAKAYGAGQTTFLDWKQNQGFLKKSKSEILDEFADEILEIRRNKRKKLNSSNEML